MGLELGGRRFSIEQEFTLELEGSGSAKVLLLQRGRDRVLPGSVARS